MSDRPVAYDGAASDMTPEPELAALDQRLRLDATLWETESGANDDALIAFAHTLPQREPLQAGTYDGAMPRTGASERRWLQPARRRVSEGARRIRVVLAPLVVVVLIALLVTHVPNGPGLRGSGPAATASPIATDAASPSVIPTPTTTAPTEAATSAPGFMVTGMVVDTAPSEWTTPNCDPTMPFRLMVNFAVASNTIAGTITYRWLRSDGYVSQPQTATYTPGRLPGTQIYDTTWDVPAAQGDGSVKWAAVEVLSPNRLTSSHSELRLTCQFSVGQATPTVSPGGAPAEYNCQLGGDQTFTFNSTIPVYPAPGNNVVTYHWLRSDGVTSPDYTVTVPVGAASATAQPDTWIIHQSDVNSGSPRWEEVVVTSPTQITSQQASFVKFC